MQRRFSQGLIISFIFLSSIFSINTPYIYAGGLAEEAQSYREKGYDAQEKGEIDSAISWYQKAADLDSGYAAPHNDLGILFEAKGWLDRAESSYERALSINPDYEKAHTNLALLYERKGELEKAAFHWMRRYKLGRPDDPWTKEASQRLEKLGLIEEVGKKRKVKLKKYEREVRTEKPKVKIKEKKSKKDIDEWTRVDIGSKKDKKETKKISKTTKSDLNSKLQESLRLAEERLRKEKGEKTKVSKQPIRKKISDTGVRSYYLKAQNYYRKGEYSKALDTIRTAKKAYSEDLSLLELEQSVKNKMKEERIEDHYNEGIVHYRRNDFQGARQEFEAILNILPE